MSLITVLYVALFCIAYALTKLLIDYAHKRKLFDIANHRSSHTQATPRIGGLSFVIIISTIIGYYSVFIASTATWSVICFILLPLVLVALTGLIDDVQGLKQSTRFSVYFFCALLALGNVTTLFTHVYWVIIGGALLLSLSCCWLINLFNFMDGIDGIAASEGIFVLIALSFFSYQGNNTSLAFLLILSTAPVAGFLVLNWQPAKIFMGDIGSTFLGCFIACICLYAVNKHLINFYSVLILLAAFTIDATWTLAYRLISGQRWYEAHRSHCYQILSRRLGSHKKVTLLYTLINMIWLFPLALAAQHFIGHALLITTISLLPLIALCFIIGAGKSERN